MELFGSWWERIRIGSAAPKLLVAVAVLGVATHAAVPRYFAHMTGWIWG